MEPGKKVSEICRHEGMPIAAAAAHLGVSRSSYFRWKQERAWQLQEKGEGERASPIHALEALPEEKQAVIDYALMHPEIRNCELARRILDVKVVCLSSSTVFRLLKDKNLMGECPGCRKRYRDELEKASRPD